jgi:hypothetical protein
MRRRGQIADSPASAGALASGPLSGDKLGFIWLLSHAVRLRCDAGFEREQPLEVAALATPRSRRIRSTVDRGDA